MRADTLSCHSFEGLGQETTCVRDDTGSEGALPTYCVDVIEFVFEPSPCPCCCCVLDVRALLLLDVSAPRLRPLTPYGELSTRSIISLASPS